MPEPTQSRREEIAVVIQKVVFAETGLRLNVTAGRVVAALTAGGYLLPAPTEADLYACLSTLNIVPLTVESRDALASDLGAVVRMLKATEPGGPAVSVPSGFRDAIAALETWMAALDASSEPLPLGPVDPNAETP